MTWIIKKLALNINSWAKVNSDKSFREHVTHSDNVIRDRNKPDIRIIFLYRLVVFVIKTDNAYKKKSVKMTKILFAQ